MEGSKNFFSIFDGCGVVVNLFNEVASCAKDGEQVHGYKRVVSTTNMGLMGLWAGRSVGGKVQKRELKEGGKHQRYEGPRMPGGCDMLMDLKGLSVHQSIKGVLRRTTGSDSGFNLKMKSE